MELGCATSNSVTLPTNGPPIGATDDSDSKVDVMINAIVGEATVGYVAGEAPPWNPPCDTNPWLTIANADDAH